MIDLNDWRHLRTSPNQEDLVGDVELAAVNLSLHHGDAELRGDLDDARSGDPFKDVVVHARGHELPTAHHEEVLGRAL